jgi:hypothetical protein
MVGIVAKHLIFRNFRPRLLLHISLYTKVTAKKYEVVSVFVQVEIIQWSFLRKLT